jgi:GNAT superfamily N-acetyltransferase
MDIRLATEKDLPVLCLHDKHVDKQELENLIRLNRVYLAEQEGRFLGWLRYNLFWDNTPFMNMIYLLEESRGKGIGRQFVEYWENAMKMLGYGVVMTSTASDEYAQHFYGKLGYQVVGGFLPDGDPFELILSKRLS